MKKVSVGGSVLRLIGSVHSQANVAVPLGHVMPQHLFVEANRDVIGLLRKDPNHSPFLRDLPAILTYAQREGIPVHPIDASIHLVCQRLFREVSRGGKFEILSFLLKFSLLSPVGRLLFVIVMDRPSSMFDGFVTRWGVESTTLATVRRMCLEDGASIQEIDHYLQNLNELKINSFISRHDIKAFTELCSQTGIDQRLQSVLIDWRNEYMCEQIRRVIRTLPPGSECALVVGINHIEGMERILTGGLDYVSQVGEVDRNYRAPIIDRWILSRLLRT